ncbi:TetR/AcrR family transcriptional regulator [Lachnospiraceae bacterium MD1]|uniref:TetR/AcrR family transcriptional regulator n=1 Tax=Variimorphobacter saccharofermentans TaxID=2755051 RepID=A0A839K0G9_9FIRM|nr:TetR/AcrR family transcriptional regulator [Variimorphobacter saccharofermentans]MBB2182927.1 TetR/AcrR family transcriptional regulator [Variimorphobacter saccharofermentans]
MRVIKEYDERRSEIIDTAEQLFETKGYDKCTVNDILKKVGIAKGTFYYYFKSKEEVMDAIVAKYTDIITSRAEAVLQKKDMSPEEKLMDLFMAMRIEEKANSVELDSLHKPENALFHQKVLSQTVTAMAPILEKLIKEGNEKKVWHSKYPLQYMQIFLAASLTLLDEGIFVMDEDSKHSIMEALFSMLEKMLELPEGYCMQLLLKKSAESENMDGMK